MADGKVQIGTTQDYLEGTTVTTPAGTNLFREGVVVSDPDVAEARVKVINSEPTVQRDADGGAPSVRKRITLPDRPVTRDDVIAAADQIEALIEQEESLKTIPKKVREYVSSEILPVSRVSDLQAELAVQKFEYSQRLLQEQQEQGLQTLLILEQISVILRYVQDDEEALIALLLA